MQSIRNGLCSTFNGEEIFALAPECDDQMISLIRILGKRKRLG